MRIVLAEYATGTCISSGILAEGRAILKTLAASFERTGHEVVYPSAGSLIGYGTSVESDEETFSRVIEREAKKSDFGLVIAPDHILPYFTSIVEDNTVNLGCTPESVQICADKLRCSQILEKNMISTPTLLSRPEGELCVTKPRYGCASENTRICSDFRPDDELIAMRYIEGEHVSASFIAGQDILPLSINLQFMKIGTGQGGGSIEYNGCITPYSTPLSDTLFSIASSVSSILGCRGYTGIDFVIGDRPYVVDVNPRPTTSLVGICQVMEEEIADLLLKNIDGELPETVNLTGKYSFTKEDIR